MTSGPEKVAESEVHETLYKNILVLIQLHPAPNKELHDILRKDMFVKNNRTAFNQVVYYLLYTLGPSRMSEKIKSWPVYDPQYDRQFRNEVMKYLNELNGIYEDASMPLIMASQLVSPGGLRFTKYMLKLSILVMGQCLQQKDDMRKKMLLKPKLQKGNESAQLKKLNILTSGINKETEKLNTDFHIKFIEYKEIANEMVDKLNKIQSDTQLLQEKLEAAQCTKEEDCDNMQHTNEEIELLTEKLTKIKKSSDILVKIKNLVTFLTNSDLPLENTSTSNELDLISSLENFNLKMERVCFEMKTFTDLELNQHIEKFVNCNEELTKLENVWVDVHQKSVKLFEILNTASSGPLKMPPTILQAPGSSCDSTILATPLDNSKSQ